MTPSTTALILIDVQESFRQRPYWSEADFAAFSDRVAALARGAAERGIPLVQIFHVEDEGAFSLASGYVRTLAPLAFAPDAVFHKHRHSALVGSGLPVWLTERGVRRLIVAGIRTEQCCETTARHASDLGFEVDFASEATLTFAMKDRSGRLWSPAEIKARTELVLDGRFARVVGVEQALEAAARSRIAA